eukprot:11159539-Lingulodinium_polyedra.AAC.1
MVPRSRKFSLEVFAAGVVQMWKVLTIDPAQRQEQASQILEWCVADEVKMVAEAMRRRMEGGTDFAAGGSVVGGSLVSGASRPRALVRTGTNEEYERVQTKSDVSDE